MTRTEIERLLSDTLDVAEKLNALVLDVQGLAERLHAEIDRDTPTETEDSPE